MPMSINAELEKANSAHHGLFECKPNPVMLLRNFCFIAALYVCLHDVAYFLHHFASSCIFGIILHYFVFLRFFKMTFIDCPKHQLKTPPYRGPRSVSYLNRPCRSTIIHRPFARNAAHLPFHKSPSQRLKSHWEMQLMLACC